MSKQAHQLDMLSQYTASVLRHGPDAVLPTNLSDCWLDFMSQDTNQEELVENPRYTSVLASVLLILSADSYGVKVEVEEERLFEYIELYRLELSLEKIRRVKSIEIEPATLETILTRRDIKYKLPY